MVSRKVTPSHQVYFINILIQNPAESLFKMTPQGILYCV